MVTKIDLWLVGVISIFVVRSSVSVCPRVRSKRLLLRLRCCFGAVQRYRVYRRRPVAVLRVLHRALTFSARRQGLRCEKVPEVTATVTRKSPGGEELSATHSWRTPCFRWSPDSLHPRNRKESNSQNQGGGRGDRLNRISGAATTVRHVTIRRIHSQDP